MNFCLFKNFGKKIFHTDGILCFCLFALCSLLFCSCTSGSFYVLNTGQYMLEHNIDRQFYITSESQQTRGGRKAPAVPIYKVDGKCYVAAERVSVRENVGVGGFIGEGAPTPYCFYHRHEDERAYYEVELSTHSGELFFSLPSGSVHALPPAFTTLPADADTVMAYYAGPDPSYPSVTPAWDDCGNLIYTCEKNGDRQLRLTNTSLRLSWRALYGLPSAAILCVAVDTPFNLVNFTGFCIRSIFN